MDYLFLLGRLLLGGFFLNSAYGHFKNVGMMTGYAQSKGIPMPREAVIGTGIMLLLGGLGIILGVWIQVSVLLLTVFLLVTSFTMHEYWKDTDQMQKMSNRINFFKNMALLGSLLMILMIPMPWVWALMK